MKDKQTYHQKKPKSTDKDLMESFSPWTSVGKMISTSTKKKENVFNSYRPKKQCIDYTISETFTKFQSGDLKVNVRQTTATYKDIPEEICKPKRKKKIKYFSGGPPQWKFIDEIWRECQDEVVVQAKTDNKKVLRQRKSFNNRKYKNAHAKVQEMCGPEWFMELSPNQQNSINTLRQKISLDMRKRTTTNTQEVLAELGLVLRPRTDHVRIAIMHSCGCPTEFLLVLYQLINPKRKRYSLNDRLLLSSVVHLSITQTLHELHVRIPSPPRVEYVIEKPVKKEVKIRHESPYLQPLTIKPLPPKYTGIYKNKHQQHPESPYFSYLYFYELDKIHNKFCFNYSLPSKSPEKRARIKEYQRAQEFYESLPGVKEQMLGLIAPSSLFECPNMLHPRAPRIKAKMILPRLCPVWDSEPEICFCKEKPRKGLKKTKRSCCERNAEKYLQSVCWCDDCLDEKAKENLVRICGGVQKSVCKCDDPVPVIEGTLLNKTCECYKEYRNKVLSSAARQKFQDQDIKFVISGVIMTKNGPVYKIINATGEKICLCEEIKIRKQQVKLAKEILLTNENRFVVGGVAMTQNGPVYSLSTVVARKPCKCLLKYHDQLKVLAKQNEIRKNPTTFVNNGLVNSKFGFVFYLVGVLDENTYKKDYYLDVADVCPCIIKKPKCFKHCQHYFEYKETEDLIATSEESRCVSNDTSQDTESSSDNSSSLSNKKETCPYCKHFLIKTNWNRRQNCANRYLATNSTSETSTQSESELNNNKSSSISSLEKKQKGHSQTVSIKTEESLAKSCKCKDELERFMKSKCPCEECNRKIRQSYATYIVTGIKTTSSGNQVNIVQGINQPLCKCLPEHIENVKRIDEYKSRTMARYNMKKQQKKYYISGVANTSKGPVYIISGLRPPVECECAKALREEEEKANYERQRAKMPETGRIKYEIQGVRGMPDENVFIMSRTLKVTKCECEELLKNFEDAHKTCMDEYEEYLKRTDEETNNFINELQQENVTDNTVEVIQESPEEGNDEEKNPELDETKNMHLDEDKDENGKVDLTEEQKYVTENASSPLNSSSMSEESSSEENESSESVISECGSCHAELAPEVKPIELTYGNEHPDFFISKRFAIFKTFPKSYKRQKEILIHILNGMAEDGFPLAKLPQVHKLPIFKLWLQMRSGVYWTYEDRLKYQLRSQNLWRHTFSCFQHPSSVSMPFTKDVSRSMTWRQAELIRKVAAKKMDEYYRNVKHSTVDTCREFFASTFSYEFPTPTWKDCFFAYSPSKEEEIFPYKIYQSHDVRIIPNNKKMHCYC